MFIKLFLFLVFTNIEIIQNENKISLLNQYRCDGVKELFVYYFDGDCAFCIDKIRKYYLEYSDDIIFLAKTKDKLLLKYTLENEFEGYPCVVFDEDGLYDDFFELNRVEKVRFE